MNKIKISDRELIALVMFFTLTIVLFKSIGLYPSVVDEYVYSSNSRLLPLSNSNVPDYLYRYIYSIVGICNKGWIECARLLNGIFFVMSAPFIFFISRRYTNSIISSWITLLSLLGPINTYTAYFMPESMYFLVFWVFAWATTTKDALRKNNSIIASGIILGALSLIKPHALFLLPVIFIYGIIYYLNHNIMLKYWIYKFFSLYLLSFFFIKFFLGFIFSGVYGISLFGSSYSSMAGEMFLHSENLLKLAKIFLTQIYGNISAVSLIYYLPLTYALYFFINFRSHVVKDRDFLLFSLLITGGLISISAIFTAQVDMVNATEGVRLHMRYYNFSLPLLLIIIPLMPLEVIKYGTYKSRLVAFFPFFIILTTALLITIDNFSPNYVDGPEIRGYYSNIKAFYFLGILSLIVLTTWIFSPLKSVKFYLFIFFPLYIIISGYYANIDLRNRIYSNPYDRAAIFAGEYLGNEDLSRLLIIGPPQALGPLVLSKIYINNANVQAKTIPEGEIENSNISNNIRWIITVGSYDIKLPKYYEFYGDGFTLTRIQKNEVINFNNTSWAGIISSYKGLGPAESWGRWSYGKEVQLNFNFDLPDSFKLTITASPTKSNLNKEVIIHAGGKVNKVYFSNDRDIKEMYFKNIGKANSIYIEIPDPEKLDNNQLGIGLGFNELKIDPITVSVEKK